MAAILHLLRSAAGTPGSAVPGAGTHRQKDIQVPAKENLPEIEKALKAGGNKDYTVKELPHLNHLFQTCRTGNIDEYGRIEETFAPSALKLIADWISRHTL